MDKLSQRTTSSCLYTATEGLDQFKLEIGKLASLLDRETVLREATEILTRDHRFDCGWFAEHVDADAVTICYESGMVSGVAHNLKLRRGCGLGGKVFALNKMQWTDEYFTSSEITHHYDDTVRREKLQRIIGAPICADGEFVGVVLGGARDGATFGNQAATTMEMLACRTAEALVVADAARTKVATALSEERARMAHCLNDTVGTVLFAIAAGVRSAGESATEPCLRDRLVVIESRTKAAAFTLRQSLRMLQTPTEQLAWSNAMQRMFDAFEARITAKTPQHDTALRRPHALVRQREYEVLCRVASGETNQEIAKAMGLSENTVKSYLRNLMQRLEVRNRVEAIARARELGLL